MVVTSGGYIWCAYYAVRTVTSRTMHLHVTFLVIICASARAASADGLTAAGGACGRSSEDWRLGVENAATGNLSAPCCELSPLTGCDTARQSYGTSRPDFFAVIGVQKSGTTSLTNHLNSHPSICVKGESRLMLLLSGGNPADPLNPARGNPATQQQLARDCSWGAAKSCSLLGLVDPGGAKNFYDYPAAAARVLHAMQAQRVKLVMLLREPMQRCFSLWKMACAGAGFTPCTSLGVFENLVAAQRQVKVSPTRRHDLVTGLLPNTRVGVFNPVGCIQTGMYGPQLARLRKAGYAATLDVRPSTRLLVLISERFSANHSRELTKVWEYLGVRESVTQSGFDRVGAATLPDGTPFNVTLSHEAVSTMWPLLRNSTEQTYTLLKSRVSEWETWYANMNKHPNALTRQRSA